MGNTETAADDLHILCWDDERINHFLAVNLSGLPGVGYYGPTKAGGMHEDYRLCQTPAEAQALYREHWGEAQAPDGHCLLFWRDGWGPVEVPDCADDAGESLRLVASSGCQVALTREDNYWRCTALPKADTGHKRIAGIGGHSGSAAKAVCYALIDMLRKNR